MSSFCVSNSARTNRSWGFWDYLHVARKPGGAWRASWICTTKTIKALINNFTCSKRKETEQRETRYPSLNHEAAKPGVLTESSWHCKLCFWRPEHAFLDVHTQNRCCRYLLAMTLTLDPQFVQRSCLFFSESWEKVDLYGSCAICVNNNTPLVPSAQSKPIVAQLNKLTS